MTAEEKNEFTLRISQANHSQLLLINYDIVIKCIEDAKEEFEKGNLQEFLNNVRQAQKFHQELIHSLNVVDTVGLEVMQLYLYVNKILVTAVFKKEMKELDSALTVLRNLRVGFEGMAKQDFEGPIMQNTQQIYAGLTYGKGYLNESYMDPLQQSRGLKA